MSRTSKQAKDSADWTDVRDEQVENTTDYKMETKTKLPKSGTLDLIHLKQNVIEKSHTLPMSSATLLQSLSLAVVLAGTHVRFLNVTF